MPDYASTGSKAAAKKANAKGPRNYFAVEGRGFTLGQKIIYTDKDGREWKGTVKKHTEAEVTEENSDKVKMLIHVPEKGGNVQVMYHHVLDDNAPASVDSGAPLPTQPRSPPR